MTLTRRALALAGAATAAASAAPGAWAQTVLNDYEPAKAAGREEQALWRLSFRPPLQVLQQTVSQLRTLPRVTQQERAQADMLIAQAAREAEPSARRSLWRAAMLLLGREWTPGQERLGALALRSPAQIAVGQGDHVRFDTLYPSEAAPEASYSLQVYRSAPTTSATPLRGARVRDLGAGRLSSMPMDIALDFSGLDDGAYLLIARVSTAAGETAELVTSLFLLRDLATRDAALRAMLASVKGHEEAKAVAEYPFALAKALQAGRREVISYDFPRAIIRSRAIADGLKAGRDGVRQATGLQDRAYRFPATGELVPFQLYVPTAWTPTRRWPLIVALHGANLDETNMLGRAGGAMQKLAEQHGVIVAAPLGYRLNSGYGSERGGVKKITGDEMERRRRSEADVLQVTELVSREYNVDPARRYLTGNSMGGAGTWWIGGRHAELWAAIAPAAFGGVLPQDAAGLKPLPIMAVVGDHDELGMHDRVRDSVATLRAAGLAPEYVEVPGGTHASGFDIALPRVFDFFSNHSK